MEVLHLVVPAYNESENIDTVIDEWYPIVERINDEQAARFIVIDDGSTDDTYSKLRHLASTRPLLESFSKPNGGHGSALIAGYRYAIQNGATWIFQTDSDGQTTPLEFDEFWNIRNDYDAIIGVRNKRQDGAMRVFVERVLCLMLRLFFGVRIPDANAPFRLMRSSDVQVYLDMLPQDFNLPNVMLTTYFVFFNKRVSFKEISFRPRQKGSNSINLRRVVTIGRQAVGDFWTLRKGLRRR